MAPPLVALGIGAGIATLLPGIAQQRQGSAQQEQARENANAAEADAVFESAREIGAAKDRSDSIRARQAAAGSAPDQTLDNLIEDELLESGLNAAITRVGGEREALRQRQLGTAARSVGDASLIGSAFSGVATGLQIAALKKDRGGGSGSNSILGVQGSLPTNITPALSINNQ